MRPGDVPPEVLGVLHQLTPRQLVGMVQGFQRYEAAGAPYGATAADAVRWLEEQPGGFPDPELVPLQEQCEDCLDTYSCVVRGCAVNGCPIQPRPAPPEPVGGYVEGTSSGGEPVRFYAKDYADPKARGFKCPRCGGWWFRTDSSTDLPPGKVIRSCKDQFGTGCKWSGPLTEALDPDEDLTVHPLERGLRRLLLDGREEAA